MEVYNSSRTAAEMEYALGAVPSIGENGNWFIGEEDTGLPSVGVPTATQVNTAVRDYLTENPVVGGEWTKLGDVTVDHSAVIEFIPISITGGVVTFDPSSENYDALSSTGYNFAVIVSQSPLANDDVCLNCILKATDYATGTFSLLNGDFGVISQTYDTSVYKIVLKSVKEVSMSNIPQYKRYKFRYTAPYCTNHGMRRRWSCNVDALTLDAETSSQKTGGVIVDIETMPIGDGSQYHIIHKRYVLSKLYGGDVRNNVEGTEILGVSGVTIPANGTVTFNLDNDIWGPGARFQLWGSNE